jgi:hypothetical protein
MSTLRGAVGKLWAAPNTLLGLLLGLPSLAFGARIVRGHNALQFLGYPLGSGALTLGNVVLYAGCGPDELGAGYGVAPVPLGLHEQAHTLQYERLGPLFLPVYVLAGGISSRNPLERAADAYAGGGSWWPW